MDSNGIGDFGKFDFMNKGMYPMSQLDRSYYASPTQVPLAAQTAQADYDPRTNPLTGEPVSRFADGGSVETNFQNTPVYIDPAYGYAHDPVLNAMARSRSEGIANKYAGNQMGMTPEEEADFKVRAMALSGMPKYDPRYMPLRADDRPLNPIQAALLRLEAQKQLGEGQARAGITSLAAALPGQQGVKMLPGSYDVGYNVPAGPGNLDISAYRAMRGMPDGKVPQGIRANYSIPFAEGGIARFNGEEDSEVPAPKEEKKPPTMAELADQIKTAYRTNANYDQLWKDFAAMKESDPQQWYRHELAFLGNQVGWQQGQNTSERSAALEPQIKNTIAEAKKAGLGDDEIKSIFGSSQQSANIINQRRIAEEAAQGKGWVNQNIPGGWTTVGAAAALAAAPYAYGALAGSGAGGFGLTASSVPSLAGGLAMPTTGALGAGTLGAGTAAGATGFGLTAASVPSLVGSLAIPTTGALAGGAGAAGGSTLAKMMATKMALETLSGGSGGGSTGASPVSGTSYTPFSTGQSNQPLLSSYNPTSASPFGIAGMTSEGYYGYKPTTFNYSGYGIRPMRGMASGGIADLAVGGEANLGSYSDGGQLLKGPGDGMSDHIPATIGGEQPARLAEGEFVIPADVVSHLGNGSTDAGAKQLYKMMDKIRHARTGTTKQGKQINPDKFFPKG